MFESLNLVLLTSSNKDQMSCCNTVTYSFKNVGLYDTEIIYDVMLEGHMKLGKCKLHKPHK